jgi:biotin carboxylase
MNIVFLSPHFPPTFYLFCVWLRNAGANVIAIADAPYDSINRELREALTEYYRVDSMENYDELLRACGYFTHRYGRLHRVESHNEYWLETEAQLRTDFNIPGIKNDGIAAITRKSEMKKRFRQAGVSVASGKIVKDLETARQFATQIGYPAVLKPDRGVGAANTFKVSDDTELQACFAIKPAADYIMEEFIEGQIVSFDGLTDHDGQIVFYTSHVFSQGIMEIVNEDRDIFYYSQREIPDDLTEAGHKSIAAFGVREKFFHLEFFRTPDNRLVAIEANMRPPGGLTTDMFNYANDIDLYEQWANVVVGNEFTVRYFRPYHCGYVGRKLGKSYKHSHREIMDTYGHYIVHHGAIQSVFSAAIGNYGYVARTSDLAELTEIADFIRDAYEKVPDDSEKDGYVWK